jgi:hypothetical protein
MEDESMIKNFELMLASYLSDLEKEISTITSQRLSKFSKYLGRNDAAGNSLLNTQGLYYSDDVLLKKLLIDIHLSKSKQSLLDALVFTEVSRRYQDQINIDKNLRRDSSYFHNLPFGWYLSLIIENDLIEKGFFEAVNRNRSNFKDDMFTEHLWTFLFNMLESTQNQQLMAKEPHKNYDVLFNGKPLENGIQFLCDLHIKRVCSKKSITEDDPVDCITMGHYQFIPVEALGYFGLVKKVYDIELEYKGTIAEPFIDANFEREVKDETCLYMIEKMSERCGVDLMKEVLG